VIVEGSLPVTLDGSVQEHHARRALNDAKHHLQKSALKLVGYLVAAYVVLKLSRAPPIAQGGRSHP
jgi:cell division ATPase FtsA